MNYNILAKCNNKGLAVEHLYRFLNKSLTIATENRGTNNIFVGIVHGLVAHILRNISAIGQKVNIIIDININVVPKMS